MRHRVKHSATLGCKPDHRALLLRNIATSLVEHGRIETTATKARAAQAFVERVIATAKNKAEPREAIRYLKETLLTEVAQKKLFTELVQRYAQRKGGFTRITPLGLRAGDSALRVQLELV